MDRCCVNISHGCLTPPKRILLLASSSSLRREKTQQCKDEYGLHKAGLANLVNGGWKTLYKAQGLDCTWVQLKLAEDLLVKHVLNTKTSAIHLVHWTDTALGGTNKILCLLFSCTPSRLLR